MQWRIVVGAVAVTLACFAKWQQSKSLSGGTQPTAKKTGRSAANMVNPPGPITADTRAYQFIASLKLGTPLSVLEHHRDVRRGPKSTLPAYGGANGGTWVLKEQINLELTAPRADKKLAFLKDFRRIVESKAAPDRKRQALLDLASRNDDYSRIIATHKKANPNWADEWVGYEETLGLKGIGSSTARKLYDAGYHRSSDLKQAGDKDIGAVKGIGPATISKIRELLEQRAGV